MPPRSQPHSLSIRQNDARLLFNKTLAGCYQQSGGEYKNVDVLFLLWEDDDLGCKKEVDLLRELFENEFSFTTQTYEIPSKKSASNLQLKVAQFVNDNDSPDNLAIVYYGGHGVIGEETRALKLAAKGEADSNGDPKVFLNDILKSLRILDCDVFVILDCCHAGRAFFPEGLGMRKFELLTASAETEYTKGPNQPDSFTTVMTKKIKDMLGNPTHRKGFTVSSLYRALYHDENIYVKPLLFDMSHRDYGRLWLRPRSKAPSEAATEAALTTLTLTLHIANQTDDYVIHEIARGLQYLKNVQKIELNELHAPESVVIEFVRSVRMARIIRNWHRSFLKRKQKRILAGAGNNEIAEGPKAAQLIDRRVVRSSSFYDWTNSRYFIHGQWMPVKRTSFPQTVDTVVRGERIQPLIPTKNLLSLLSTVFTMNLHIIRGLPQRLFPSGQPNPPEASDGGIVNGQRSLGGSRIIHGQSQRTYPANPNNSSKSNLDHDWEFLHHPRQSTLQGPNTMVIKSGCTSKWYRRCFQSVLERGIWRSLCEFVVSARA